MREYKVTARAQASMLVYVFADSKEEALAKAGEEIKNAYEDEWDVFNRRLVKRSLEEVKENE